jgi:hypothetical protein
VTALNREDERDASITSAIFAIDTVSVELGRESNVFSSLLPQLEAAPNVVGSGHPAQTGFIDGGIAAKTADNWQAGLVSTFGHNAVPAAQDRHNNTGGYDLKTIHRALLSSALALPLSISAALASETMATGTKIDCAEMKYSAEFLAKWPNSPAACREARDHGGKRYAQFKARVFLNSADRTTVELLNVKGDRLSTFSFKPAADAGVMIDGKKVKFTDLKKGEEISFWVSEDRMSAHEQPGSTEESWAVLPPL